MSRFFTALPPEPLNETGERPKKIINGVKRCQSVSNGVKNLHRPPLLTRQTKPGTPPKKVSKKWQNAPSPLALRELPQGNSRLSNYEKMNECAILIHCVRQRDGAVHVTGALNLN